MTDEERVLKNIKYIIKQNYVDTEDDIIGILISASNLIKKQSKEIEELKEDNKKYIDLHYVPYEQYTNKLNEINKKWEDKIKAKIEELENQKKQWIEDRDNKHKDSEIIYAIEVLQSLLKEE